MQVIFFPPPTFSYFPPPFGLVIDRLVESAFDLFRYPQAAASSLALFDMTVKAKFLPTKEVISHFVPFFLHFLR